MINLKGDGSTMNKTVFFIGLAICLIAAALLVFNVIESGIAGLIGFIGIALIATSAVAKKR